jgi:hypothetical protein
MLGVDPETDTDLLPGLLAIPAVKATEIGPNFYEWWKGEKRYAADKTICGRKKVA